MLLTPVLDILISNISANELDVILQLLQHQVLKVLQLLPVKELCLNYYLILLGQNYQILKLFLVM